MSVLWGLIYGEQEMFVKHWPPARSKWNTCLDLHPSHTCSTRWNKKFWINTFTSPTRCCCKKSYRMYLVRRRYWSKTKIIAQECIWWDEGIDPKHFVSLLYISVAIKASLLKFSMFSVHKNTISNIFLEFSNFKIVGLVQIGILNLLQ